MLILSLDGCQLYRVTKKANYDLAPSEQNQQKNNRPTVINPLPEASSQPIQKSDTHFNDSGVTKAISRELHGVTLGETEESIKSKFKDIECSEATVPYKKICSVSFSENNNKGGMTVASFGNIIILDFTLDNGGKIVKIHYAATSDLGDTKGYYNIANRIVNEYTEKYGGPKKLEKVNANFEKTNLYTWTDGNTVLDIKIHKGNPLPEVPGGLAAMIFYDILLHDPSVIVYDPQFLKSFEKAQ